MLLKRTFSTEVFAAYSLEVIVLETICQKPSLTSNLDFFLLQYLLYLVPFLLHFPTPDFPL